MTTEAPAPQALRHSFTAKSTFVTCLTMALGAVLVVWSLPTLARVARDHHWRHVKPRLEAALRNADPVLDALDAYAKDHGGHYPSDLSALQPRYLKHWPDDQLIRWPNVAYEVIRSGDREACQIQTGVSSEYVARPPYLAILAFDHLLYRSDGAYGPYLYNHSEPFYDRIGRWAYYLD